jgi:carbonic anhydrase
MAERNVTRRLVLRGLAVSLAASGSGMLPAGWLPSRLDRAAAVGLPDWGYGGAAGPSHWGQLSSAYKTCSLGKRQSPIDLAAAHIDHSADLTLHWQKLSATVRNDGHALQVEAPAGLGSATKDNGSFLELSGRRYAFQQLHFHHPSEHALAGKHWPLEAHFVHQAITGTELVVIAVLFRPGRASDVLQQIVDLAPAKQGAASSRTMLDLSRFLPDSAVTYRYAGSLTTPPCSEIVNWVVFRDPIEAGIGQLDRFAHLFPRNARPLQPLANRSVAVDLF